MSRLLSDTPRRDIRVLTASDGRALVGGAIFSRSVFILSPMAVVTDRHGEGIGQALLNHALAAPRGDGADVAITYGDPAFYGRVGFPPPDEAAAPPLPLSFPEGWIGRSVTDENPRPLKGACACVAALNEPAIW